MNSDNITQDQLDNFLAELWKRREDVNTQSIERAVGIRRSKISEAFRGKTSLSPKEVELIYNYYVQRINIFH